MLFLAYFFPSDKVPALYTTNDTMNILDRPATYRLNSREHVLASLRLFGEQCRRGFRDARALKFPARYRSARRIIVVGMGGSTLGTDVVRTACADVLTVPLQIVNNYHVPASVDRRALVVLSSYSGTTEEVLAAAKEARRRGAMITGLTRGGALGAFFTRYRYPWYRIDGAANPTQQPRMGLGYNAMGQIGILTALGYLRISREEVTAIVRHVERRVVAFAPSSVLARNPAKQLAAVLARRIPILVGAEHLVGSVHAFANQLNETAKSFAVPFVIPELNHHLLEGLRYPGAVKTGAFVFINSVLVDPRITLRQHITQQIVVRKGLRATRYAAKGSSRLMEAFDVLALAGYTSLYLSVLHKVNPLEIQTVNEFKQRLALGR